MSPIPWGENEIVVNRVQALVLSFFAFVWVSLVVILIVAPDVYDRTLTFTNSDRHMGEAAFLSVISIFIGVLVFGVARRWRWAFWLILVAFLAGVLRVPASILEIANVIPATGPAWYALFQGLIGIVQFAIGIMMLVGYRRAGVWGGI